LPQAYRKMETLLATLAKIVDATDWRVVVPALITGLTGLCGALIGARGAERAQLRRHQAEVRIARASLAAALRAELVAYFETVDRLRQFEQAEEALNQMRAGGNIALPQLIEVEGEHLPSLVLAADFRSIGMFGPALAEDVFRLATLISSLRVTLIGIGRGHYHHLDHAAAMALLESQLELWREIRSLGETVNRRLARAANTPG
jgi:hypothetical protein